MHCFLKIPYCIGCYFNDFIHVFCFLCQKKKGLHIVQALISFIGRYYSSVSWTVEASSAEGAASGFWISSSASSAS